MISTKKLLWNESEVFRYALNYETLRIASKLSFLNLNLLIEGKDKFLQENLLNNLRNLSDLISIPSYKLESIYNKVKEDFYTQNNIDILIKGRTVFPFSLLNDISSPNVLYAKGNLKLLDTHFLSILGHKNISYTSKQNISKLIDSKYCLVTTFDRVYNNKLIIESLKYEKDLIILLNSYFDYDNTFKVFDDNLLNNSLVITPFSKAQQQDPTSKLDMNNLLVDISTKLYLAEQNDNPLVYRLVKRAKDKNKSIYATKETLNNKAYLWPRELVDYNIIKVNDISDIKDKRNRRFKKDTSIQLNLL